MKQLDDIRGLNQSIGPRQPKQLQSKQPQQVQEIRKKPTRETNNYKLPNFLKAPAKFVWRRKSIFIITIIIIVVSTVTIFVIKREKTNEPEEETSYAEQLKQVAITDDTELVVDFTFNLKMIINNQPQAIPADYGKIEDRKSIFNTDTSTGDIRVQSPNKDDYRLSDFFILWGSQFNSNCLLNHCLSGSGTLTMTVNEKINSEFDNYTIKPDDQIVITYNDKPL